jgi:hypothetical protein
MGSQCVALPCHAVPHRCNVTYCEPSLTGLGVYTMCPLTCTCRSFPCITAQPHTAIQNRFKDPHYSSSLTNHPSMTTSSCMQAKKAIKEVPKDDEEVDRQEEGDIDRGFTDSSSSSEDELTEAGKEIQALMKKQTGGDSSSEEEETEDNLPPKLTPAAAAGSSGGPRTVSPKPATPSKSSSKGNQIFPSVTLLYLSLFVYF